MLVFKYRQVTSSCQRNRSRMSYSVVGPRDIDDSEVSFCKLGGEVFFGLDLTPSWRDVLVDTQRTRNNFYSISHSICWYFFFSNAAHHIICILLRGRDTELYWKEWESWERTRRNTTKETFSSHWFIHGERGKGPRIIRTVLDTGKGKAINCLRSLWKSMALLDFSSIKFSLEF